MFGRLDATLDQRNISNSNQCLHSWQSQGDLILLFNCELQTKQTRTEQKRKKCKFTPKKHNEITPNASSTTHKMQFVIFFRFQIGFERTTLVIHFRFIIHSSYICDRRHTKWILFILTQQQINRLNVSNLLMSLFIVSIRCIFVLISFYYFQIDTLSAWKPKKKNKNRWDYLK